MLWSELACVACYHYFVKLFLGGQVPLVSIENREIPLCNHCRDMLWSELACPVCHHCCVNFFRGGKVTLALQEIRMIHLYLECSNMVWSELPVWPAIIVS